MAWAAGSKGGGLTSVQKKTLRRMRMPLGAASRNSHRPTRPAMKPKTNKKPLHEPTSC
jgi:hypothetical protein